MATVAVEVAERLVAQGIGVTVVDPRWVKPVDPALVDLAREHRLVVSVEDNGRIGGCGAVLLQTLNDAGVTPRSGCTASRRSSWTTPSGPSILERIGLTAQTAGAQHRRGRHGAGRRSFTGRCRPHRSDRGASTRAAVAAALAPGPRGLQLRRGAARRRA